MADNIKTLLAKTDAELSSTLGYDKRIASFKDSLVDADKLTGKPREHVEERLTEMLNPKIYADDLKYAVESAERMAKSKGPSDFVNGCGCDVPTSCG